LSIFCIKKPTHPDPDKKAEEKYSKDKIAYQRYSRLLTRDKKGVRSSSAVARCESP
jgi:hypothetical protein